MLLGSGLTRLLAVLGSALVLVLAAPVAVRAGNPIANPDVVVDPTVSDGSNTEPQPDSGDGTETVPDGDGTETVPDSETGTETTPATETAPEPPPTSGARGNAALQSPEAKAEEARDACDPRRPPISKMLAIGGSVRRDEGSWFSWVALTVAAGAALIAIGAYAVNHRRRTSRNARTPVGPLEISATVVAIVSGLAGLAAQFIPGVGAQESPPADAHLAVREVLARITRGEYAKKTGAELADIPKIDRLEVGQVFWLEVGLRGYRDKRPRLQYALYDPDLGGSLLVGTGTTVKLNVEDSDSQTLVVPIWVGYPSTKHFQARFRLIDRGAVRQIAATGTLSTSEHRYACPKDT